MQMRFTRARTTPPTPRRGRRRSLIGAVAAASMVAVVGFQGQAAAAPSEDTEAVAQLIEAQLMDMSLIEAITTRASHPDNAGPNTAAIDVAALDGMVDREITELGIPLIGDGSNGALLELGKDAGAALLNGYAATPKRTSAAAASGAVTDDGAIALSPGDDASDAEFASLDLTALLDQLGLSGLTDQVVDELSLGLGALASTASASFGEEPTSEYAVAGAELRVSSPLVASLVGTLNGALGGAEDTIAGLLGPGGTVQQTLDGLSVAPLEIPALATVDLGSPRLNATVDLSAATDGLLAEPLVSDNGLVAIDLSTGMITVDLDQLHGGDLNGLPANTQLLTAEEISQITDTITTLLGEVVATVTQTAEQALRSTAVTLDLTPVVSLLGGALVDTDLEVHVAGSLAQFLGQGSGVPTVDTTGGLTILGVPLPLGDILGLVTDPIVGQLLPGVGTALQPLLTDATDTLTGALEAALGGVLDTLDPVLEGVLGQAVRITVNSQPTSGVLGEDSFTVRALQVDLLPTAGVLSLPLASSSVQVSPPAEPEPEEPPAPTQPDEPAPTPEEPAPTPEPVAGTLPDTGSPVSPALVLLGLSMLGLGGGTLLLSRRKSLLGD